WVSNAGTDSGTCGAIATPCRTFQQAHDNVANGGEISVLNPGDYGSAGMISFNISKSVSVTNDGVGEAGVLNASENGIFINTGAGGVVSLRGLVVDGTGVSLVGVDVLSGALHMQKCVIRNFEGSFSGVGLHAEAFAGTVKLFVSDSLIYNNGAGPGSGGIMLISARASVNAVLHRVQVA